MIQENWKPSPGLKKIKVEDGAGYVLAEAQYAVHSQPVFRASGMDGIAVNSSHFRAEMPDTSAWKEGNEYVRADTGDDFDDVYDTVIPIEWVTFLQEDGVCTAYPYSIGETGRKLPAMTGNAIFITKLGEEGYRKGEKIMVELL